MRCMSPRLCCAAFLSLMATAAVAQPAAGAANADAAARAAAGAASAASAPTGVAPGTRVFEDDNVRIVETRGNRGELQHITVYSKIPGVKSYQIIVPPGGRDPSQGHSTAGQRAWSLFEF